MTEPPPTNPDPAPAGENSVVFTFDEQGRILSRTERAPGHGAVASRSDYRYDEAGRLLQVSQTLPEIPDSPHTP